MSHFPREDCKLPDDPKCSIQTPEPEPEPPEPNDHPGPEKSSAIPPGDGSPTPTDGGSNKEEPSSTIVVPGASTAKLPVTTKASASQVTAVETAVQTGVVDATIAPSQVSSQGSDGVSKGAVAGIAIATALIGAAIAFVIAFFLFKRRKRNSTLGGYGSTPELMSLSKAGPPPYIQEVTSLPPPTVPIVAAAARNASPEHTTYSDFLGGVLPPPADDRAVSSKVSALFAQIKAHVENFYRDAHASITPSMESDLARFGTGDVGMVDLIQGSSSPTTAIKHALIAYILSITAPDGEEDSALFPREVVGVSGNGHEQFTNSDHSAAYTLYKRLAVHLHSTSGAQTHQSELREAAEHFSLTFFPWANLECGDQEKDEDVVHIISNALDLRLWMFGQPFEYEFLWEGVGRRGLVVAPGLVKTSDARGRSDERSKVVLEPTVVAT